MKIKMKRSERKLLGLAACGLAIFFAAYAPAQTPPPTNCIAWWRGEGNANDSAGTHTGSPGGGVTFVPGKVGQAFSFNGSSEMYTPSSADLSFGNGGFSLALWVKQSSSTQDCSFITKYNTYYGLSREYQFVANAGAGIALFLEQDSPQVGVYRGASTTNWLLNDTNWHHVAATYNPAAGTNGFAIYFDGLPQPTRLSINGSFTGMLATGESVRMASSHGSAGTSFTKAQYDEIMMFNRPLTATEVMSIYASGSTNPVILAQPQSQVLSLGSPATFSVTATASTPLNYQWYFNGALVSGSNGPSFTVPTTTPGSVGDYHVVVWNAYGTNQSTTAYLWLNAIKTYSGVSVYGPVGSNCLVQYTTSLNVPVTWNPLQMVTIVTNPTVIVDYGSAGQPQRFYQTVPQ